MVLDQGSECARNRSGAYTGVAQGTVVQARAGGGGANRVEEAEAVVAQSELSTGSGRGPVRARVWWSWKLQAAVKPNLGLVL